jgi:hypothetical protein
VKVVQVRSLWQQLCRIELLLLLLLLLLEVERFA